MKLLRAKIKGLVGVCTGSGVKDIDIDFTKCKGNITLIIGANGSGKTTLLEVLHPLPDNHNMYLPGEECSKEFSYVSNGILYNLQVIYPVNRYRERTTTKAYIQKIVNGISTELNPNGNVTSYKDCIYSEFKLDPNYLALTKLSLEDKGIVTKTPAERVKFVASIVKDTEVFTNIYKTLNKRSSIFKSMINNLVSKIDSIGSEENLIHTLSNIDNRIKLLSNRRDEFLKRLSQAEAMVTQLDSDGQIQNRYTELYDQLSSVKEQIETITLFINKYKVNPYETYIKDKKTCSESYIAFQTDIAKLQSDLENAKSRLQILLKEKEEDSNTLTIKVNKVKSLRSQYNFEEMFKQLKATKDRINNFIYMLNELGLTEDTTLTKDEFILGLSTLKDIKSQIDSFRSFSYDDHVSSAIDYILSSASPLDELHDVELDICNLENLITDSKNIISYNTGLLSKEAILDKRPEKCKIDTCPFIEDALDAMQSNPRKKIDEYSIKLVEYEKKLDECEKRKTYLDSILAVIQSINIILRMINNNRTILDKLPNGYIFTDTKLFLDKLKSGSPFNEINDLYNYIDQANLFEQYRLDKERLVRLESEYEIYKNRNSIIDEISSDIEKLQSDLSTMVSDIEKINKEIFSMEAELQRKVNISSIISGVESKYAELERLEDNKRLFEEAIHSMANNIEAIELAVKDINAINSEILNIDNELKPIKDERESIKFSINKLKEYNEELAVFQAKYNKVEVIKRYSNPTKEGIQKLFIDVYMGQTAAMSNELLSMFFDGKIQLLDYDISDDQFRMPYINTESSIPSDDISSASGGESCMIALILSVALLQQSSTSYNILRLDEIDGTLDQSNRSMFMDLLHIIIDTLCIDTCIMISHASESVLDNADIICLNMAGLDTPRGNIIYTV